MVYADYTFYLNEYAGKEVPSCEDFRRLAIDASAFIDMLTHNRMEWESLPTPIQNKVRMATCAVADVCLAEASDGSAIASESVGNHSRSYANMNRGFSQRQTEKYRRARLYLAGTGLLYGGLR